MFLDLSLEAKDFDEDVSIFVAKPAFFVVLVPRKI